MLVLLQNDVESLRLRTQEHEMIIAQHENFTLVVIQVRDDRSNTLCSTAAYCSQQGLSTD
jgi:hypothetical protein